jgi:hemolysin activation/secretion protein
LNNELFRIGGANSIRGFNEQSFFTSNYTYFNLEYRYATSSRSYFYSITDIGRLLISSNFNNVIGLGGGYSFFTNNSQINFGIALGNNLSNKFQFRNPKVIINWRTFF